MPPAKTIIVNHTELLCNVAAWADERARDGRAELDELQRHCHRTSECIEPERMIAGWVPRDLCALAGRNLTASERIRHQQAIRQLEADGLIELQPRWIRLTEKGENIAKQSPATTATT